MTKHQNKIKQICFLRRKREGVATNIYLNVRKPKRRSGNFEKKGFNWELFTHKEGASISCVRHIEQQPLI